MNRTRQASTLNAVSDSLKGMHHIDIDTIPEQRVEGRPSKLTPNIKARILRMLKERYPWPYIIKSCGISAQSWAQYKARARTGKSKKYVDFLNQVQELKDKLIKEKYDKVAGSDNWQLNKYDSKVNEPEVFNLATRKSEGPGVVHQHLHLESLPNDKLMKRLQQVVAQAANSREIEEQEG